MSYVRVPIGSPTMDSKPLYKLHTYSAKKKLMGDSWSVGIALLTFTTTSVVKLRTRDRARDSLEMS